jgi:hypothetical protein
MYKGTNGGNYIMKKNEKPRAPRYKSKVPVEFESGKGFTRDFSASGIYIEVDRFFLPGSK